MGSLDLHDWVEIGVTLVGFLVTIVTVKVDMKWIKQWCRDHKADDEREFAEVHKDIRYLQTRNR
jgi:hypothetical protein